mmetsp:Transcript_1973/g.4452  ORF Transcript_1973/g.4452 Transcript_1973/m.4452 type:complete len:889 (+) Transcript_1973:129-2795(+)
MTLLQDNDRSNDISFDSDPAWEAYGTNKKKDRESHRLGSAKKVSRPPHRLGSTNDGFGEASDSSFALDDGGGFSNDWKSFTEDQGWNEVDRQQAKAWKTAQSERNLARGDGRRGSTSRRNSSSSSLDFDDFQEEPQPALKVNPSIGIRRVDRSASTRMVPKVKVNGLKHSTSASQLAGSEKQARGVSPSKSRGISPATRQRGVRQNKSGDLQNLQLDGAHEPARARTRRSTATAASLSLDTTMIEGFDTGGRRAPQRTKSMDVDMFGTGDNSLGYGTTSLDNNPSNTQSFRLGAPHEAASGRSRRRASLALNATPQVQNPAASETVRVRSRRRASLAVGAAPPSNFQDLQPDAVPNEGARMRSRRRASLAVNAAPGTAAGLQNLQLETPNETPRVRARRRASMAATDGNMDRRRGVQRTKSMDVDMLGSGDSRLGLDPRKGSSRAPGGTNNFQNVRRIHSTDSQDITFRNASRLGNESASGITDDNDIPPPPTQQSRSPRTRSPRTARNADPSSNLTESTEPQQEDEAGPGRNKKNKLSPRSRRRLNMRRINSIDSACSSNSRDIGKALANSAKTSESPTTSRRTEQGHRRRGVQRVHSSGLNNLISGLQSKKNTDLEAGLNEEENQALESENAAQKHLQTHLEDQESARVGGSADSVSNDSSAVSNSSSTNSDLRKTLTRTRSARLQKHLGASRTGKEETSGEAGSVTSGSLSHSSTERRGVITRSRSSRLNVHGGNSSSSSLKSGGSESIRSEQSRSTSNRPSRQHRNDKSASGSAIERERTPNSSHAHRKRREAPKRGVNRSKSDDAMTFGAWTSGDSSVQSRKKLSKSPSRRKSVAAGECQPHSKPSDKERVKNGDATAHSELGPHDKGFIASFLGSPPPVEAS